MIFPQDKQMWVVKLLGPEKQVEPLVGDFDKIVESVELTKDEAKPIVWKLPAGWTQLPGNKDRFATLKSPGDNPQEVSISLPLPESPLLDNVVRWRRQVGLTSPITEEQAELFAKKVKVNGVDALRVDLLGTTIDFGEYRRSPLQCPACRTSRPNQSSTKRRRAGKKCPAESSASPSLPWRVATIQAVVSVSPLPGQSRLPCWPKTPIAGAGKSCSRRSTRTN